MKVCDACFCYLHAAATPPPPPAGGGPGWGGCGYTELDYDIMLLLFSDTRDLENGSLFLQFLLTGGRILYGNLCRPYIIFLR
jgi:hypothetical protein